MINKSKILKAIKEKCCCIYSKQIKEKIRSCNLGKLVLTSRANLATDTSLLPHLQSIHRGHVAQNWPKHHYTPTSLHPTPPSGSYRPDSGTGNNLLADSKPCRNFIDYMDFESHQTRLNPFFGGMAQVDNRPH